MFKAIGRALKKLLRSPIVRAIIQIVACAYTGPAGCAAAAGAMTAAAGGSMADVFKAVAFSFIGGKIWGAVGNAIKGMHAIGQMLVHGVVNGALAVAQGGNFLVGFATGAIGKLGGIISQKAFGPFGTGGEAGKFGRTIIAAIAGCAGAVISGGKCANGAVTAAMAHLFNAERLSSLKGQAFKKRFEEITGMSVEDSIAIYKRRTGQTLTVNEVARLFSDPDYAHKRMWASKYLHSVYRSILNSNVPRTAREAEAAGYIRYPWEKNIFHNPIMNVKWVGPSGHMEGVYNGNGNLVTGNTFKGTFNFFPPDQTSAHYGADVSPYMWKWFGN